MPVQCTCSTCGCAFMRRGAQAPKSARVFCSADCAYPRPPIVMIDDGAAAMIPLRAPHSDAPMYTVIDAADIDVVTRWRWGLTRNGYAEHCGRVNGRFHKVLLHRLILGLDRNDGRQCDHIDRDRLNNRRANLRIATPSENAHNRAPTSTHVGVTWNPKGKNWKAGIVVRGQLHHLGYFSDRHEASNAVQDAKAYLVPRMAAEGSSAETGFAILHREIPLIRGSANGNAILSEVQVIEIRQRYKAGGITYVELANEYGVSMATIAHAVTGRSWGWLKE